MADVMTLRLAGIKRFESALEDLPKKLRRRGLGKAVRAGSKPIRKAARENLRALLKGSRVVLIDGKRRRIRGHTGNLDRSIATRRKTYDGFPTDIVGTSWPKGAHGIMYERGTKERYAFFGRGRRLGRRARKLLQSAGAGARRGRMPAQPFLEPAVISNQDFASSEMGRVLADEIEKAVSSLGR